MHLRFPIISLILVALAMAALGGCQSMGVDGLVASNAPAEMSAPVAQAIAGDIVGRFSEQVGPGTATIALKQDPSPFGQALETALKTAGYAVLTDQKPDETAHPVALAYVVEPFNGKILVRLSTPTVEIGRAYTVNSAGAAPATPLSVMRRG
jgi:hypothetical protein